MAFPPPSFSDGPLPSAINTSHRPEGFATLIADLVLAWAAFDSSLLELIVTAFEMPHDRGRIILGNMDMRTRLQRLKSLFTHLKREELAGVPATAAKDTEFFVHPRNVVCHTNYFGTLESDENQFVFGPYKTHIGYQGPTFHTIHRDYVRASADYALRLSVATYEMAKGLREESPPQPESDSPPTPQQ
jgi:hypothetical protein